MEIKEFNQLKQICSRAMNEGPTRIVINSDGEAVPPNKDNIKLIEVVFVRKDGWSLGAPFHLIEVARKMWDDEWVGVLMAGYNNPVSYDAWKGTHLP
jgi:hypothetical protein